MKYLRNHYKPGKREKKTLEVGPIPRVVFFGTWETSMFLVPQEQVLYSVRWVQASAGKAGAGTKKVGKREFTKARREWVGR